MLLKFDLPCFLLTLQLSEVNDFQVASPLQYQSINKRAGDENTETDQLKDVILPNIKFSKLVLNVEEQEGRITNQISGLRVA